uniref:Uncharacterized protein n=1 Tax=Neogobius melanostomus TaxID=47308 RepID=A0A8C6UYT4_9GOBI
GSAEGKTVCPVVPMDPRSPSVGITTVGSLARRLGMLFHHDAENKVQQKSFNAETEDDSKVEELASTEPLLTPQPSETLNSLDTHATMLETPLQPPPQNGTSPFVLLENPQLEVELETEPDISYEEAEEARETPLHKRLSMSLIACHEELLPYKDVDSKVLTKEDHSYAIPPITIKSPVETSIPDNADDAPTSKTSTQSEEVATSLSDKTEVVEVIKMPTVPQPSTTSKKAQTNAPSPRPQRIRCPTIDAKSPSQVVFKPQWLGKGFGGAGQRVKVQGNAVKGGSSPLALKVAVKSVASENKGNDGRSPLQILKDTNSPRSQNAQMKMKVSTPEKRRSAQGERRILAIAVDKENR